MAEPPQPSFPPQPPGPNPGPVPGAPLPPEKPPVPSGCGSRIPGNNQCSGMSGAEIWSFNKSSSSSIKPAKKEQKKPVCRGRISFGICDSSSVPGLDPQILHLERCQRRSQLINPFGPQYEEATILGGSALSWLAKTKTAVGAALTRASPILNAPAIAGALGKGVNRLKGTPCP
jgi:hypothetical protein